MIPQLLNDQGEPVVVNQGTAYDLFLTLVDTDQQPVDASNATAILLTLYDLEAELVINDRLDQNVQGQNGGTVEPDGRLRVRLDPADNVILNDDAQIDQDERHVARLFFTYDDATSVERTGLNEYAFGVRKIRTPQAPPL